MFKLSILASAILSTSVSSFAIQSDHLKELGTVTEGLFIPSLFSNSPQGIKAVPEKIELTLQGLGLVEVNIQESKNSFGRQVLTGTLVQDGQELPFTEVILVQAKNDTVMGSIETTEGKWLLLPDLNSHQQYLVKRHPEEVDDELLYQPTLDIPADSTLLSQDLSEIGLAPEELLQAAPDKDSNGNTVIDIYMGFSEVALPYVQDMDAYAVMQIATVNNALKNSQIEDVRVRLVGTGTTDQHMGMSSHQLPILKDWFAADIAKYSPDVVTGYMLSDDAFVNQATGWGYVNGYYNINEIKSPNAFRHELGHNIGGVHCNDTTGYNFGYNNGMTKTHQCGNNINYYSNPDITDMYGLAIGDPNSANMARIWRENAGHHSSYRPAVVPFENEERQLVLHETGIDVGRDQWAFVNLSIPEGATRAVLILNEGADSHGGATRLYLQKDRNPSTQDFHSASAATSPYYVNNHAMGINDVTPGNWVVGIKNLRDTSKDLQLKVYLYGEGDLGTGSDNQDTDQNNGTDDTDNNSSESSNKSDVAMITLPVNNSILDNGQVTFHYNPAQTMWLYVGSSKGEKDIFNAEVTGSSTPVSDLPQDGSTVYVTLWSYLNDTWTMQETRYVSKQKVTDDTDTEQDSNTQNNIAPMAHIIAPSTVNTPNTVVLDGSQSTDANGDNLTYIWRQTSGIEVSLVNPQQAISQFNVDALAQDEIVSFKLTVFDGQVIDQKEVSIILKANTQTEQDQNENKQQDDAQMDPNSDVVAAITVKKGAGSNSLGLLLMLAGFMSMKRRN